METSLLYLILFILLFQLFIFVVLSFKPKDRCCKKDCCCEGKKLCECEDIYDDRTQEIKTACCKKDCCCEGKKLCECEEFTDVVTQLKTKSACCKDDESDCDCELPDPIEINEFPSRETTIGSLGTPENRTKTFRGISYQDLKDREPLEENDPNINKK